MVVLGRLVCLMVVVLGGMFELIMFRMVEINGMLCDMVSMFIIVVIGMYCLVVIVLLMFNWL